LPLKDEIAFVVNRLEHELPRFQLEPGQLDRMLRAMFACHDLGKLDVKWQAWAHEWQRQAGQFYGRDLTLPSNYMAAHTDYDSGDEKQRQAQHGIRPQKPNHAGEGGMAAATLFDEISGNSDALWKAAITAVFRHHSAATSSYESYAFHKAALPAIRSALEAVHCPTRWADKVASAMPAGEPLGSVLVDFDGRNREDILLYFLLVRVLRLADQRSQQK
jgi:CRISPR-associated endonuclease/helicase Cas3